MNPTTLAQSLDLKSLRSFVQSVRNVLDAMLIHAPPPQIAQPPAPRDYNTATIGNTAPAGGWLDTSELRNVSQRMNEAIAAEKWTEGFLVAIELLATIK